MPKEKDFKRRVRARMEKTGESYTAARARLLDRRKTSKEPVPPGDLAGKAGMSDAAVRAKTGRTWAQWVRVLDAFGAAALPHRDIARYLHGEQALPSWWAQTITVGYERIRGLREKGQRRGGGFEVNKSKTLPVPLATVYAAFGARRRRRWLGEVEVAIRKATPGKSMRLTFGDGTPLDVQFDAKGPAKSQVRLQHRNLPSKAAADRMRAFWTERLAALAQDLRPRARP